MLEQILEEGLSAMVPVYEGGNVTQIVKNDGSRVVLPRTCKTVLKNIARVYGVDIAATRRVYRDTVNKKHRVPLPFTAALVLIPMKMREHPLGDNDGTLGYVNYRQIGEVEVAQGGCRICLKCGQGVASLVSRATVREYMKNAQLVEKLYIERHLPGTLYERDTEGGGYGIRPHGDGDGDLREYLVGLLLEVLEVGRR